KRICNFRYDQTENAASSGDQRTRLPVWIISKFFDGFPDPLRQLSVHGRYAINRARHRGCGYFRSSRDITNVHVSSSTLLSYSEKAQYTPFRSSPVGSPPCSSIG